MSTHPRERFRVRPLLAVAAAFSVAACSSTQPIPVTRDPAATVSAPSNTTASTTASTTTGTTTGTPVSTASAPATLGVTESPPTPATTAAKPLTMPNGSPACGNVTMRAPPNPDCK